jgi:hypothetical protein
MEQENEIFVILKHPLFEEIRVIIPQRSHEPLRMLNDENLLFLENSAYICDGEVILIATGDQYIILM